MSDPIYDTNAVPTPNATNLFELLKAASQRPVILVAFALALTACASSLPITTSVPNTTRILLDADTANELDDLYAIAQVIAEPDLDLIALTSSHFNNTEIGTTGRWHAYDTTRDLGRGLDTVGASQRENKTILDLMGATGIPHPLGAREMIGYSWGYFEGAPVPDAPAVDAIIAEGRAASPEGRLDLVAVGPLTNVAAALIKAPDIAPNVRVWWLGAGWKDGVWNKNRFNVRNDLNAADYLLDSPEVELIMMPTETARALMFQRDRTLPALAAVDHPLARHLADRWAFVNAQGEWTQWDMALTLAIAHPEWATLETVAAPPENEREAVKVFTAIDAPAMEAHFFDLIESWAASQRAGSAP